MLDRHEVGSSNLPRPTNLRSYPVYYTYVLYSINFNKMYIGYSSDAKKATGCTQR